MNPHIGCLFPIHLSRHSPEFRQTDSLAEWSGFSSFSLWVQLVGLVLAVRRMDRGASVFSDQPRFRSPDFLHLISLSRTPTTSDFLA